MQLPSEEFFILKCVDGVLKITDNILITRLELLIPIHRLGNVIPLH
jgi:hypothetical protein